MRSWSPGWTYYVDRGDDLAVFTAVGGNQVRIDVFEGDRQVDSPIAGVVGRGYASKILGGLLAEGYAESERELRTVDY